MAKKDKQSRSTKSTLSFYLFTGGTKDFSKERDTIAPFIKVLNYFELKDANIDLTHYGTAAGLYHVWKNDASDYIGFSLDGYSFDVEDEVLLGYADNNTSVILPEPMDIGIRLIDNYSKAHYNYDIEQMLDVIKQLYPFMADFARKDVLYHSIYYLPMAVVRKDVFRKFCLWLFPILEKLLVSCKPKISAYQNRYLEYLSYYLINIYFRYYKEKLKVVRLKPVRQIVVPDDESVMPEEGDLLEKAQTLIDEGHPEQIEELIAEDDDTDQYKMLKSIFEDYKRQRRYASETDIDRLTNINELSDLKENKRTEQAGRTKRVVFFNWDTFNGADYVKGLSELGFEVYVTRAYDIRDLRKLEIHEIIERHLSDKVYDLAFSVNYLESIASACYAMGVPYIAWAYDSPTDLGDWELMKYDTNNIFLFDSSEADYHRLSRGMKNVHYVPLAVDCDRYDSMIPTDEDIAKYSSQVSFVGQIYENKLDTYLQYFGDYKKGYMNGAIDYNVGIYDNHGIDDIFDARFAGFINDKVILNAVFEGEKTTKYPLKTCNPGSITDRLKLISKMTISKRERLLLIALLSKHFDVKMFSKDSHSMIEGISSESWIDYYKVMPIVFKCSKINLNITMKGIQNGIPLRCLDVMGCHGFLLSNYQKDFDADFKDGENVALFDSIEEAYDKCAFYLEHEDERMRVAENGYQTVKKYYNYKVMFERILKIAGLAYLLK